MDVHPNPGPTAIQRKLFNNAKRLQLNVTRYEHHILNYSYYRTHEIIPKGQGPRSKFSSGGAKEECVKEFFWGGGMLVDFV